MSLKILVLPTFIILEIAIAIGYIKPNVDAILAKRSEIAAVEESLARVDSVNANIQSVGQSLKSRSETVNFVRKYYPLALDEERVVDLFNYLAQQSGIIVTGVEITKNLGVNVHDVVYNESINAGSTPEQAAAKADAAALAAPHAYLAKVTALGAYPNLKDFLARVHHSDRLHAAQEFSIIQREKNPAKSEEEAALGIQDSFLIGSVQAEFPYVGEQRVGDALSDPIFQESSFDFKVAEQAITFVTSPLPPLDTGSAGRPNPYE